MHLLLLHHASWEWQLRLRTTIKGRSLHMGMAFGPALHVFAHKHTSQPNRVAQLLRMQHVLESTSLLPA